MIRINLLGRLRPKVKRRVAIAGTLQLVLFAIPVGLAMIALILHSTLIIRPATNKLREDIAQKESEKRTMAQLQKEVEEYEAEQKRLQARLDVIENLKRNQAGPVRLLEAVGHTVTLTETLWLTDMEERAEGQIQFKGLAGSVNAVANFITNLQSSGYFQNVEIKESVEKPQKGGASNFEFTLTAKFALPAPPAAAPPSGTPPGGGM
ncbi:MAG: PilN domain-containing protein [Acidobacteria bacterium]|nr:PilN domain-containing protein [Acidobacteriota bacterium]